MRCMDFFLRNSCTKKHKHKLHGKKTGSVFETIIYTFQLANLM